METELKPWYLSRAIWGALVSLLSTAMLLVNGVMLPPDVQHGLVELGLMLGSLIGGAVALYGRVVASHRIGTPPADTPATPTPPAA